MIILLAILVRGLVTLISGSLTVEEMESIKCKGALVVWMCSMQLAYPLFLLESIQKQQGEWETKMQTSFSAKVRDSSNLQSPKGGVRAAKSSGDQTGQSRAEVEGSWQKMPHSEFLAGGQGAASADNRKKQMTNSQMWWVQFNH